MKASHLTAEQWKEARIQYECDPSVKLADIARSLGVTRGRVSQIATKAGWQKRLDPAVVADQARQMAISKLTHLPQSPEGQAGSLNTNSPEFQGDGALPPALEQPINAHRPPVRPTLPVVPPGVSDADARAAVTDAAVAQRAEVVKRHQIEHQHLARLTHEAIKSKDKDQALHAEICSRTMERVQGMERKWWGLEFEKGKEPVRLTVIRRPGLKAVG
jgi:hypothetical protein